MLHRWTEVLWDKGTGGGRWNYKIPMTELCLNGNFLNWFWRGARQYQHGETLRRGEGEDFSLSPSPLFRSLSLWTCSSPPHLRLNLSFYPTLKLHRHTSVLLFQYLLLNLYCSLYSAHVFCSPAAMTCFFFFYSWYLILRYHRGCAGLKVSECNEGYMDSEWKLISCIKTWMLTPRAGKSIFSYFLIVKWCFKDEYV